MTLSELVAQRTSWSQRLQEVLAEADATAQLVDQLEADEDWHEAGREKRRLVDQLNDAQVIEANLADITEQIADASQREDEFVPLGFARV